MDAILGIISAVCWIIIGIIVGCEWYGIKNKKVEITITAYTRLFCTFILAICTIILTTCSYII